MLRDRPDAWRSRALRECSAAVRLFGTGLPHWWSDLHRTRTIGRALFDDLEVVREGGAARRSTRSRDGSSRISRTAALGARTPARTSLARFFAAVTGARRRSTTLLAEARDASQAESAELERLARALTSGGWPTVQAQLAADHPAADDYLLALRAHLAGLPRDGDARELVTWPDAPIRYVPIPDAHA